MKKPLSVVGMIYTVSAKVETLRLDGERAYVFHGGLSISIDGEIGPGEALQMALHVPYSEWAVTDVGDSLVFSHTDRQRIPLEAVPDQSN